MKAFKTYELCPIEQRPFENIPLEIPWQVSEITEQEVNKYVEKGFTVMSDSDYENYVASYNEKYKQILEGVS